MSDTCGLLPCRNYSHSHVDLQGVGSWVTAFQIPEVKRTSNDVTENNNKPNPGRKISPGSTPEPITHDGEGSTQRWLDESTNAGPWNHLGK